MKVVVTGANGMLGRVLVAELSQRDHEVRAIVRDPRAGDGLRMRTQVFIEAGDVTRSGPWQRVIDGADAVVHLAGPPLHGTAAASSSVARVTAANELVRAVTEAKRPPASVVVASSLLAYGERPDVCDESTHPLRTAASELALAPEAALLPLVQRTRVVALRFAQILGPGGLLRAVKTTSALPDASARAFSWISVVDAVSLVTMALRERDMSGVVVAANTRPIDCAQLRRALEEHVPQKRAGLFGKSAAATASASAASAALPLLAGVKARPSRALALGAGFREEALDRVIARSLAG